MGDGTKIVQPSEKAAIEKMGKSIWPSRSIKKDELLTELNLVIKTPAGGIPPYEINNIIGGIALNDLSTESPLIDGDFMTPYEIDRKHI